MNNQKDTVTREQVVEWAKQAKLYNLVPSESILGRLGDFAIFARATASASAIAGTAKPVAWIDSYTLSLLPKYSVDAILTGHKASTDHVPLFTMEQMKAYAAKFHEERMRSIEDAPSAFIRGYKEAARDVAAAAPAIEKEPK